jgi:hypothetical protein
MLLGSVRATLLQALGAKAPELDMSCLNLTQVLHLLWSLQPVELLAVKVYGLPALGAYEMVVSIGVSVETNTITMHPESGDQSHIHKHPQGAIDGIQ